MNIKKLKIGSIYKIMLKDFAVSIEAAEVSPHPDLIPGIYIGLLIVNYNSLCKFFIHNKKYIIYPNEILEEIP